MAERDTEQSTEEQRLKDQLDQISLEYQRLVEKSQEMAPKDTNTKKVDPNAENTVDDDDFEEIANVANNLDSLNTALDTIEERADSIRAQLLELLASNREIRQSIREENEKLQLEGEPNEDSNAEPATEQDSNQKSDE